MAHSIGPDEASAGYEPLVGRIQELFTSSDYSDLKITCDGSTWDVHRNIVCPASPFFKSCCEKFKEAQTGVIDLPDDSKDAVHALLSYIYTADYKTDEGLGDQKMLFQVRVHTIADKYDLLELCTLAESKFAALVSTEWHGEGFALAVKEMYAVAPDSKQTLQKVAVETAIEHAADLLKDEDSDLSKLSREIAPFASALFRELLTPKVEGREKSRTWGCPVRLNIVLSDLRR